MMDVATRRIEKEDWPTVRKLITSLYQYHSMPDSELTIKDLEVDGSEKSGFFKAFLAEINTTAGKRIVGYTLYYFTYSIFLGRTILMQDLFVEEKCRRLGIGEFLLKTIMKDAFDSGCRIVNFHSADWNAPTNKFYAKHGAITLQGEDSYDDYRLPLAEMVAFAGNTEIDDSLVSMNNYGVYEIDNVTVRKGERNDCPEILRNIIERSKCSKRQQEVQITVEDLEPDSFGNNKFYRHVIAEVEIHGRKQIVGHAIYTFGYNVVGRATFMDDINVMDNFRSLKLETAFLKIIIQDALDNGCKIVVITLDRLKNKNIAFYKNLGAPNWSAKYNINLCIYEEDTIKKLIS